MLCTYKGALDLDPIHQFGMAISFIKDLVDVSLDLAVSENYGSGAPVRL